MSFAVRIAEGMPSAGDSGDAGKTPQIRESEARTMSDSDWRRTAPSPRRVPIFNMAPAATGLIAALLLIHVIRVFVIDSGSDALVVAAFAFIPWRETVAIGLEGVFPGGDAARLWSPLTYAFLHADWAHVLINTVWLAAFGSPLAMRLGSARFLVLSAVGAVAGALLHLAMAPQDMLPMVGASAAISAHMGAAARYAFVPGLGASGLDARRAPALSLAEVAANGRVLAFIAVWFGINLMFAVTGSAGGLTSGPVAWDAHVGGFVVGLLLFPLFDRRVRHD
jgi:membrane associated rhomboid family serine protease